MVCDRTLGEGDPRIGVGDRRDAQAGGLASSRCLPIKNAQSPARLILVTTLLL
jgi:hypothetical protein